MANELGLRLASGIIRALFPALTFVSALAIAACLTPMDPILAAAIIGGRFADKSVPAHLSHLLRYATILHINNVLMIYTALNPLQMMVLHTHFYLFQFTSLLRPAKGLHLVNGF